MYRWFVSYSFNLRRVVLCRYGLLRESRFVGREERCSRPTSPLYQQKMTNIHNTQTLTCNVYPPFIGGIYNYYLVVGYCTSLLPIIEDNKKQVNQASQTLLPSSRDTEYHPVSGFQYSRNDIYFLSGILTAPPSGVASPDPRS